VPSRIRRRLALQGRSLGRDDGQGLVEYALILGLVSVVAITVLGFIGTDVNALFQKVDDALKTAL
jgi:pilus assembly protein Flp/PilA